MPYHTRIIEKQIAAKLKESDAVYVEGSMGVGKSALLRKLCDRTYDVKKALSNPEDELMLDINPAIAFKGKGIHGVDGIDLDYYLEGFQKGKAVYSSSRSTGKDHLTLYPLSFYEQGISNGAISLLGLFSGAYEEGLSSSSSFSLEELSSALIRGGYPASLGKKTSGYPKKVIDALINGALAKESKTEQTSKRLFAILKRYASSIGSNEKNTDLLRDLRGVDPALAESTLYDVLNALKRLLILDEIEAWYPPIKAAPTIRRLPKKEFIDPSLALACLKKSEADLLKDPSLLSRAFEGASSRDLKVYSSSLGGKVKCYEDRFGLRSDLVLFLNNGKYALIQARLGEKEGKLGEKQLLELRKKILVHDSKEPAHMVGLPSFMMVVTNGEKAYRAKSGVYYVPLACLGE